MRELELKYGCNPNQKPARIYMSNGADLPITVRNGTPGYINLLDALNAWQLVHELAEATGHAAAASFKHVSPASAALDLPMSDSLERAYFVETLPGLDSSRIARAYVRARGTDRMSSFGDWAALSDTCDEVVASFLAREVSDGIIAPGYTPEALEILKKKRRGSYTVLEIDPEYEPPGTERKEVFGITFEQTRNKYVPSREDLLNIVTKNQDLPPEAARDLLVALVTLKYTQSNSVCFAADGQAIGVGAGQQSRIHCTRLAGSKADTWHLRQHPKVLELPFRSDLGRPDRDNAVDGYINGSEEDVCAPGMWPRYFTVRPDPLTKEEKSAWLSSREAGSLASDAFFPFPDNIERAWKSGVKYIAQPGGSVRDDLVTEACDAHGMVMAHTGMRLFHH